VLTSKLDNSKVVVMPLDESFYFKLYIKKDGRYKVTLRLAGQHRCKKRELEALQYRCIRVSVGVVLWSIAVIPRWDWAQRQFDLGYASLTCFKVYQKSCRIHLRQSLKTRRALVKLCILRLKVVDWANWRWFSCNLWAGIHDAWLLGWWASCGYLLVSLVVIATNDSLYAIAFANGPNERSLYPVPC